MVSRDDCDNHIEFAEPPQRLPEQLDRFGRRDSPVIDVAGDDDQIRLVRFDNADERIAERHLIVVQRHRTEAATEMPVAGVNNSHQGCPVVVAGVSGGSPSEF